MVIKMSKKNIIVDVHVIQTVPPSCINRDDVGSPKTARYGGVTRARISSQCWKKAIRVEFEALGLGSKYLGFRTSKIPKMVADAMMQQDTSLTEDVALKKGEDAIKVISNGLVKNGKMSAITFMSQAQINAIAEVALSGKTSKTDYVKAWTENPSVDMALFGRMLASVPDFNVDAAAQVSHVLSTHEVQTEYDFYTATDDMLGDNEAGAVNLGTLEFQSSTLYRHANVNVNLLRTNLLGDDDLTVESVVNFVKAFVLSMPQAKQTSYANRTVPDMVYVTIRNDQSLNLVNAFESAVKYNDGYTQASIQQFVDFAKKQYDLFDMSPVKSYVIGDYDFGDFAESKNLLQMLDAVKEDVDALLKG